MGTRVADPNIAYPEKVVRLSNEINALVAGAGFEPATFRVLARSYKSNT